MSNPVATNLAIVPVDTGKVPRNGAKAVPVNFDFSTGPAFDVDLVQLKQLGQIEIIQSVFIDNSLNNQAIVLTISGTRQSISVPPLYQGIFPIFVTDKARFTVTSTGSGLAQIQLANTPATASLWAAVAVPFNPTGTITVTDPVLDATVSSNRVNVTTFSAPNTVSDNSGTIAVGNTSQQAAAANAVRQGWSIQNLDPANNLYVNIGAAATTGPGSYVLGPFATLQFTGTGSINVLSANAGAAYTLKQW